MKSIFISRNKYGESCLEELIKVGHTPNLVISLKDKYKEVISDFGDFTELTSKEHIHHCKIDDIRFYKNFKTLANPEFLRGILTKSLIKSYNPDVCFLFGFGEIIKEDLLNIPSKGWIGTHPTLLPKYRGGAPLVWPIIKGHEKSGVTLMLLNKGLDTGDILFQKEYPIKIEDNAQTIYEKMTDAYKSLMKPLIKSLDKDNLPRKKQVEGQFIEQWGPRNPEDGELQFNLPSDNRTRNRFIYDQIRAVSGVYPSAFIEVLSLKDYERTKELIPSLKENINTLFGKKVYFNKAEYSIKEDKINILNYNIQ